jgi:RNA-directed DNA polymerase
VAEGAGRGDGRERSEDRHGWHRLEGGDTAGRGDLAVVANIYIHRLLQAWKTFELESKLRARIINYADDLVIVCRGGAEEALTWLKWITERLGLSLNEAKTCVRDARGESFDFLGYTFAPMMHKRSGQKYLGIAPSKKRVKRFKQSLRAVMSAGNQAPLDEVVRAVNRKLQGWSQYFSIGTLEPAYRTVDRYTEDLLRKFLVRRHKVPGWGTRPFSNRYLYEDLGLVRLHDRRRVSRSHAVA